MLYKYSIRAIVGLTLVASLVGCKALDKEEAEPAWLIINDIVLKDNLAVDEGPLSEDITDAWVFVDDQLIGMFELPAKIPVLDFGDKDILVGAGIKLSTVSTARFDYTYYTGWDTLATLAEGKVVELNPSVTYRDGAVYNYINVEDFEDGELRMQATNTSNGTLIRSFEPNYVKYGAAYGEFKLNDSIDKPYFRTTGTFSFPRSNGYVYLELDFNLDTEMQVGLYADNDVYDDQAIDILILRPTDGAWKKAYIAIDDAISQTYNAENFYFYFNALPADSVDQNNLSVRVDNVKIAYTQ